VAFALSRDQLVANRVTPANKLRLGLSGEFQWEEFAYERETITSDFSSKSFDALYVKGLGSTGRPASMPAQVLPASITPTSS